MDVKDALPGTCSAVRNHAERLQPLQLSNLSTRGNAMAHKVCLAVQKTPDVDNFLFGNHQQVNWCDRINVSKRETVFVFVDNIGWNFTIDYFPKDGRHIHLHYGRAAYLTVATARWG